MGDFHHESQKIAENRVFQCVEVASCYPDIARTFSITLRVSIERILQRTAPNSRIDRSPMMQRGMCISPASLIARLAIFLARSPMRSISPESGSRRYLAQVDRHRLAALDRQNRRFLDIALQYIEAQVAIDGRPGEIGVEIEQGLHGVG